MHHLQLNLKNIHDHIDDHEELPNSNLIHLGQLEIIT